MNKITQKKHFLSKFYHISYIIRNENNFGFSGEFQTEPFIVDRAINFSLVINFTNWVTIDLPMQEEYCTVLLCLGGNWTKLASFGTRIELDVSEHLNCRLSLSLAKKKTQISSIILWRFLKQRGALY